jgi:hypothetical protein
MADPVPKNELVEAIYKMVEESVGIKQLKASDITKGMIAQFGEDRCSRGAVKEAIRELIDSGRCVYAYLGGSSSITIPRKEGSEPDK